MNHKFTIKGCRGTNPLYLNKKTTENHINHKTNLKTCKVCQNERMKLTNAILPCPNCGLFALRFSDFSKLIDPLIDQAEIYCSACLLHWGRTRNW